LCSAGLQACKTAAGSPEGLRYGNSETATRNSYGTRSGVVQPAVMDRVADDVDPAAEIEFPHRVGFVHFDRLDAQRQLLRDLLVRVADGDQPEDFAFAIADLHMARDLGMSGEERAGDAVGQRGVEIASPLRHRADRRQ